MNYKLLFNGSVPAGYVADPEGTLSLQDAENSVLCGIENPTEQDVVDAKVKQEADAVRLSYIKSRKMEYPPITDYLDAIVKGDTAQQQAYIDACLAVKAKYPKGTE